MFFYFLIAILGLVLLVTIHEFGHFLLAKKFGVPVEEFGIGFPPRIFGIKIGATLYSLNLLPLGAFVKIPGLEGASEERIESIPIHQRVAIMLGGVIATWIAAFVIFSLIAGIWGLSFATDDNASARVQIMSVSPNSPAEEAGLKMGDFILGAIGNGSVDFQNMDQLITFLKNNQGNNVELQIQRGSELLALSAELRSNEDDIENGGTLGVAIAAVNQRHYKWYQAPWAGLQATAIQTITIPVLTVEIISRLIQGEKIPGARMVGPIGIVQVAGQQAAIGWDKLLSLLAVIAIYFSIFNLLPLPALDGGRILFLGIEKIMGRSPNRALENRINTAFFFLLIGLLIFVSIRDILYIIHPS